MATGRTIARLLSRAPAKILVGPPARPLSTPSNLNTPKIPEESKALTNAILLGGTITVSGLAFALFTHERKLHPGKIDPIYMMGRRLGGKTFNQF